MTATLASPPTPTATAAPDLNVTPLIDILLVLLTMMILTVPVLTHSVKLELPAGAASRPTPTVQLDIDFDGRVFWNGEPVSDDAQLAQRFTQVAALNPQPNVRIWPDRRGEYGRVAQVMAAAQRTGVQRLGLAPTE